MKAFRILLQIKIFDLAISMITYNFDKNISDVANALSEIIKGLSPIQLAVYIPSLQSKGNNSIKRTIPYTNTSQCLIEDNFQKDVDDFIYQLHNFYIKSVIFYDIDMFFNFIEFNLIGSIESVNLIFCKPHELSVTIQQRKLAHRLSLFIFYWGSRYPPKATEVRFREPFRAVVITRPRKKAFRIYYNQAVPDGIGNLLLMNWYDGENLGLQKMPILPNAASVYANFKQRIFKIPVFHSPPWFWVNYQNGSNFTDESDMHSSDVTVENGECFDYFDGIVTGGRDHRLLNVLAEHMHFQFIYIDTPGKTQGSLRTDDGTNESFTGGIGLLQNRFADLLLGDVSLSWERHKAVEFTFFTLADSGAFVTQAPHRLNEAFAVIRPFKGDVWPYLISIILISGPIFYLIIAGPYVWQTADTETNTKDLEGNNLVFYMSNIKEITLDKDRHRAQACVKSTITNTIAKQSQLPKNLFGNCIWFTVKLFLRQSCEEIHNSCRVKFLMMVYWFSVTYVLTDVYSAQLTSQFARPPHETPINTLERLQKAMLRDGYQLFVEKESSSLDMLENGTEIFRHLYALMKRQSYDDKGYLIESVESGIKSIAEGSDKMAVLAGRETLYFNMQQFGSKTFQLSQKLYTRYSAIAVQMGCPFLDSLNDVLIHLFEGGILDKMTNAEYAIQSRMISKERMDQQRQGIEEEFFTGVENQKSSSDDGNNKSPTEIKARKIDDVSIIQPLNLCMLQGAFIILVFGFTTAGLVLLLELLYYGLTLKC